MSKLVSIIIPVFNVEKHIRKSLNSILNQTFNVNDVEVIMLTIVQLMAVEKLLMNIPRNMIILKLFI